MGASTEINQWELLELFSGGGFMAHPRAVSGLCFVQGKTSCGHIVLTA